MTQPIQEPSTGRSISGLDWGQSQLARRPAPTPPGGGTEILLLRDWDYVSDNTVPNETWTPVADAADDKGFFQEAYQSPGFVGSFDFDAGTISLNSGYYYWLHAWVQMNEDFDDGDVMAVAINHGSGYRVVNYFTFNSAAPGPGDHHFMVTSTSIAEVSVSLTKTLEVWVSHSGTMTIRGAQFEAVQFTQLDHDLWQERP